MKRYGNLYPSITDFSNLLAAARQAQRSKRFRDSVLSFNYHLESNLLQLQQELQAKTYQPGEYRTFEIFEPKRRLISAAPYRDRVVHHALCNVIVPIFQRTFIGTSYANRVGFGSHRALQKFVGYARSNRYVLQCDIRRYFPSIDLEILKSQIRRKVKCRDTLWLIDTIIDNSNNNHGNHSTSFQEANLDYFPGDDLLTPLQRPKGLPIGNLTSQFFANVYLNGFDHFVKEELNLKAYLRYVDDFALFADDPVFLAECREAIETYLIQLRLTIHPIKSQLSQTHHGASFLGFRVLPDRIRVRNHNLQRGRKRLQKLQAGYLSGQLSEDDLCQSLQSWVAHLEHGDTWRLRQAIFKDWAGPLPESLVAKLTTPN
ncbi:MAG: RNA-directed DNA polymerase [Phormidium sp. BM_Day4_Bin.17]|nr:RNA-directed DNA polymerase [Phormidium sp. BM_Day4_Bin.17]UCJ12788.1 MAG: RNA-directed DNA polymerase [Phormidium sp. PBR-2020]